MTFEDFMELIKEIQASEPNDEKSFGVLEALADDYANIEVLVRAAAPEKLKEAFEAVWSKE